jgi:hypothetical protein
MHADERQRSGHKVLHSAVLQQILQHTSPSSGCKTAMRNAAAYSWQQRLPLRVPGTDFGVVGGGTQPGHKDGKPSENQRVMRMMIMVVVVLLLLLLLLLLLVVVMVM